MSVRSAGNNPLAPSRHCSVCNRAHPAEEFAPGTYSHVCTAQATALLRRRLLRRTRLQGRVTVFLRRVLQAFKFLRFDRKSRDAGKEVWAASLFSFLRGETLTARAVVVALYSWAFFHLGPLKTDTWLVLASSFSTLNLLIPYIHRKHYSLPLQEVREQAASRGLAVSQDFQLIDLRQHLTCEKSLSLRPLLTAVQESVGAVVFFEAFSLPFAWAIQRAWGWTLWLTGPSVAMLGGGLFFRRLRSVVSCRRASWQWVDAAILVLSQGVFILPFVNGAWLSPESSCGLPGAVSSIRSDASFVLYSTLIMAAYTMAQSSLLEAPLRAMGALTILVLALHSVSYLATVRCIELETGTVLSPAVTNALLLAVVAASGAVCAGARVQSEKRQILHYLRGLPGSRKTESSAIVLSHIEGRRHLCLTAKLPSATPADLPPNLRQGLVSMFKAPLESLTGVIRPGCVQLGLTARFERPEDLQAGWTTVLSHEDWNGTLLRPTPSPRDRPDIQMNIQGTPYMVGDGRLRQSAPDVDTPCIASVTPLAPSLECKSVKLKLKGLGGSGFKVLLRSEARYYELPVVEERMCRQPEPVTTAITLLPEALHAGFGWLEVMVDTQDRSLVMSETYPVLFTPIPEVSKELSARLPKCHIVDVQCLAKVLEELGCCLHHGFAPSPWLLLEVIELGLTECFERLATSRRLLQLAENMGQGLLGAAAMSDCSRMVQSVISALDSHTLPVDPCRRGNDATGFTALHWAAHKANFTVVYMLLAEVAQPRERWYGRRSRQCGRTPAEVMAEAAPDFFLDEATLREWDAGDLSGDDDGIGCAEPHVGKAYSSASNRSPAGMTRSGAPQPLCPGRPPEDDRRTFDVTSANNAQSTWLSAACNAPGLCGIILKSLAAFPHLWLFLLCICVAVCLKLTWEGFSLSWTLLGVGVMGLRLVGRWCLQHATCGRMKSRASAEGGIPHAAQDTDGATFCVALSAA